MKLSKTVRLTGALLAGVVLSLFSANSFALTASGTTISNLATVNYKVGGVSQTSIGSSQAGNTSGVGTATTFLVDTKLLISVATTDVADVSVAPGSSAQVLTFTVTNNGNATQGVLLTAIQESGTTNPFTGNADSFDVTSPTVFVESGGTAGYTVAQDTATNIPQLAAGASMTVYIVSTIPAVQADGTVAVLALKAQVAVAGGSATYGTAPGAAIVTDDTLNAWTPGTVQKLFADAAGNAADSDILHDGFSTSRDAYVVSSAKLTITKSVLVLSDPTGDVTKHAIPGAVVQYTITIANASSATSAATNIAMTDPLPANTTWGTATVGTLAVTAPGVGTSAGTIGLQFSCPDGTTTTASSTSGSHTAVSCDFGQTTASTVTVSGVYLAANDTASIVYTVTIN
jgi:uncharacterized repeat protein (TIGR01451 family)